MTEAFDPTRHSGSDLVQVEYPARRPGAGSHDAGAPVDGVALITLDRPRALNALSFALLTDLTRSHPRRTDRMDLFRPDGDAAPGAASGPGSGPSPSGVSFAPEHDWSAAAALIFPVLRPVGTLGTVLDSLATPMSAAGDTQPVIDAGPVDLVVAYAISAAGFHVLANGDHVAAWSIPPAMLRETAFRNLAAWSARAPWSEEVAGRRRILSSDTGDGWDAARILLPEVTAHLGSTLGEGDARVLIGLPARYLLLAGALRPDDREFGLLFADFVRDYAEDSDEAIDLRVFELVAWRLAPFSQGNLGDPPWSDNHHAD